MTQLPDRRSSAERAVGRRDGRGKPRLPGRALLFFCLAVALFMARAEAQDDQLNNVHVKPPASATPDTGTPKGAEKPAESGPGALKIHPGSFIRIMGWLLVVS